MYSLLKKIHCKDVALIEDVIIHQDYRNYWLGKILINKLKEIFIKENNCYKIILQCKESLTNFYNKCSFETNGINMRFNI